MISFDIIISTYKNHLKNDSLLLTIRSILSQSVQPQKIIIAENEDFQKTQKKVYKEFGNFAEVIDATAKMKNISFCRNIGAKYADNEIIIFMDDDVILSNNDAFANILQNMQFIDFSCGAKRYWTPIDWYSMIKPEFHLNHILNIFRAKSFIPKSINRLSGQLAFHDFSFIGNLGAIRRNVFESIGGYDENYMGWRYQDTDLMMRLCYENYRYELMSNYNTAVYHLSHKADKHEYSLKNEQLFLTKQKTYNLQFSLSHFFGIFSDDSYALFTEWKD